MKSLRDEDERKIALHALSDVRKSVTTCRCPKHHFVIAVEYDGQTGYLAGTDEHMVPDTLSSSTLVFNQQEIPELIAQYWNENPTGTSSGRAHVRPAREAKKEQLARLDRIEQQIREAPLHTVIRTH